MRVTLWNDYICPWAYAARPHTDWLRAEGHEVVMHGFELHPDIPPEGRRTRPGGRLDQVFDHIADECSRSGLEFAKPDRSPNTHRLLGQVEVIGRHAPDSLPAADRALARIHWVEGEALDDEPLVFDRLRRAGVPVEEVAELLADGEGERLLEESMAAASDVGVTGTPAWRIGEMTITGLHPLDQFQRWVDRIAARNVTDQP